MLAVILSCFFLVIVVAAKQTRRWLRELQQQMREDRDQAATFRFAMRRKSLLHSFGRKSSDVYARKCNGCSARCFFDQCPEGLQTLAAETFLVLRWTWQAEQEGQDEEEKRQKMKAAFDKCRAQYADHGGVSG